MSRTVALYHHLPPGGAERAMYELVRHTADDIDYVLFRVDLGTRHRSAGATRSPIEDLVAEVRTVDARSGGDGRLGRWAVTVPAMLAAERRIADAINDDSAIEAVVTHHQRFLQVPGIHRRVRVPSLYFVQEPRRRSFEYALRHGDEGRTPAARLTAPLDAWARRHDIVETRAATALLCNSEHSREYIWRAYGRDATVVRLGVDGDTFALRPPDAPRHEVLSVGSLDPTKDHGLAIDALATIDPEARPSLRIVHNRSDPATRAALIDRAARLGVALELTGDVDERDLVTRYQQSHAVLLTARVEPLGLTALEAMACGTPVVAVREGGYRETVLDGVNGLLVDRDAQAMGAAVSRVVAGAFEGRAGAIRDSVTDRFSWPKAAATYRTELLALLD